jgi:hypothetical protein
LKEDCQIFLDATYQNGKNVPNDHKNTRWQQNVPNGRNIDIDQMAIRYTKISHHKTLQTLTQIGIFGLKIYHLATLD